ncbi:MAG: hypothetical protein ACJARX_000604 [Psychroserpens sp.]|uniref:hypothetical protein n=1 Tax=Psychroserpens sp. TaxID=2020870 RepID=UPI0039E3F4E2
MTTDFKRHIGDGEVFHVFIFQELAIEFIDKKLLENCNLEFNIYNGKGDFLFTKDKNEKRLMA